MSLEVFDALESVAEGQVFSRSQLCSGLLSEDLGVSQDRFWHQYVERKTGIHRAPAVVATPEPFRAKARKRGG